MVDFHTHILPAMDDGCKNTDESKLVLASAVDQGITTLVATPHFYPENENPDSFLKRRSVAGDTLTCAVQNEDGWKIPDIFLGAEVAYYSGIGHSEFSSQLCIVGTNVILIEMPFRKWEDHMIQDVLDLHDRQGLQPVLAHLNRYLSFNPHGICDALAREGLLLQWNAEAFLTFSSRGKALRHMKNGLVHILASDTHNPTKRPETLGQAAAVIQKHCGNYVLDRIQSTSFDLLHYAKPLLNAKNNGSV